MGPDICHSTPAPPPPQNTGPDEQLSEHLCCCAQVHGRPGQCCAGMCVPVCPCVSLCVPVCPLCPCVSLCVPVTLSIPVPVPRAVQPLRVLGAAEATATTRSNAESFKVGPGCREHVTWERRCVRATRRGWCPEIKRHNKPK